MLEQRNLKLDLAALGLLALVVFLGASLLSFDPADPPNKLVYPERTTAANLCGRSGAVSSAVLFNGFGIGAYYLVISLAVVDAVLLARRPITVPYLRLVGWLLSLAGFCTLAALALPGLSPGPVIGSGGYLGAAGRALLERNFAATGAYIIVTSFILSGLLLCTDYVLVKILALTLGVPAKSLARGTVQVGRAYAQKVSRRRSDLDPVEFAAPDEDDEEEDDEEAEDASVRINAPSAEAKPAGKGKESAKPEAPQAKPSPAGESKNKEKSSVLRICKPKKDEREEVMEELDAVTTNEAADYELPSLDLLVESEPFHFEEHEKEVRRQAKILEKTFLDFGFNVKVVEIQTGPVIAQFEVELEAGLRLSKITGLADDLAIALRVPSVRIVAPIPGKNTVGIEVPNSQRQLVRLREVMEEAGSRAQSMRIPIFLGKDVAGQPMIVDLSSLPHLLIAGRTGTGKSVCLNSIIVSLLMTRRPDEVRTLFIDPKMVELSGYKNIPHLMHPVVTDMRKAEAILAWAVEKMEERYQFLARAGVRHVSVYNQLGEEELMERMNPVDDDERKLIPTHMPYIVIVADEMADLMMTAAKEVEQHIIRLAQKSRAVGIHLVLATQKPTVDVITGLIKSNLPARICFQVASRVDSRVVLDEMGADKLLGNGDMLFLCPGISTLLRGQGTYLDDDEINRVIDSVATSEPQYVKELVQLKTTEPDAEGKPVENRDDLYDQAVDLIIREGRGSCSLLQRALGIGYGRAARLIDFMAEDGVVGTYNGSQAREVLITLEQWAQRRGISGSESPDSPAAPAPRRSLGKIVLEPSGSKGNASPGSASSDNKRPKPKPLADDYEDDFEDEYEGEDPDEVEDELEAEDDAPFEAEEPEEEAEDEDDVFVQTQDDECDAEEDECEDEVTDEEEGEVDEDDSDEEAEEEEDEEDFDDGGDSPRRRRRKAERA